MQKHHIVLDLHYILLLIQRNVFQYSNRAQRGVQILCTVFAVSFRNNSN